MIYTGFTLQTIDYQSSQIFRFTYQKLHVKDCIIMRMKMASLHG